jgi:hypothetical protein
MIRYSGAKMRSTQTFILRLFVDTDTKGELRGALQAVSADEVLTFTDEQALLALLHHMTGGESDQEQRPPHKEP